MGASHATARKGTGREGGVARGAVRVRMGDEFFFMGGGGEGGGGRGSGHTPEK